MTDTTAADPGGNETAPAAGEPAARERAATIATAEPSKRRPKRSRRFISAFLVVIFSLSLLTSVLAVWGVRQVVNEKAFSRHMTNVVANPAVQASIATYLTKEVVQIVNPQARVEKVLPTRLDPLAGPLTNAVQTYVQGEVQKLIATPKFQAILVTAISKAHAAAINLLEGNPVGPLEVQGNSVVLNTLPLINQILAAIGQHGIFGHSFTVPSLTGTNGEPSAQLQQLASHFGRTLPPTFGQITVFQSDKLSQAQTIFKRVHRLLIVMVVLTLLLLILTFVVSPFRRRTAVYVGIGVAVVMLITYAVTKAINNDVVSFIKSPVAGRAAQAVTSEVTSGLTTFALWLAIIGVAAAVVAFVLGESRSAVVIRGWLAVAGRWIVAMTGAHPDGARILGAVVGLAIVLIAGIHWPSVIIAIVVEVLWQVGVSLVVSRRAPAAVAAS